VSVLEIIVQADTDSDMYLPPQLKCAAHTLNLIATTDADKAVADKSYSRILQGSFGKCQALWNAVHRSSKASDAVKELSDKMLISPCPTRWNSKFDAIGRLLELTDKLAAICDALSLPRLKPVELDFLKEYHTVMQPVAATLDLLQGDINCFYGILLPKLVQLRNKLKCLETGRENHPQLQYAKPLLSALLQGMTHRYGDLLDVCHTAKEAKAAVSHPKYKLRWVAPQKKEEVTNMFVAAVTSATAANSNATAQEEPSTTTSSEDEDYGYDTPIEQQTVVGESLLHARANRARVEALNYLDDREKDLQILSGYPNVCATFLKYNTSLPSSAPVERLFSTGGLILTPRRNKLSDDVFEQLLMLKTNADI